MLLSPFLPIHHTNCSYTVTQLTKIAAAVVGLALLAVQWSAVLPSLSQRTTSAPWKKNSSHVTQVASTIECILDIKESHFSSQYIDLGQSTTLLQRGALVLQEIYVFLFSGYRATM